jgi:argininosuccinate synthase
VLFRSGLYKGNIQILKRESATGLFSPEIRSIKSKGFSQKMAKDAAVIRGLPFEILARRGGIE